MTQGDDYLPLASVFMVCSIHPQGRWSGDCLIAEVDEFAKLDTAALRQACVASVQQEEGQHVGRSNRLIARRVRLGEALRTHSNETRRALCRLLDHPDLKVQLAAAFEYRLLDHDAARNKLRALRELNDAVGEAPRSALNAEARRRQPENVAMEVIREPREPQHRADHWQACNPPAPGMPRPEIAQLLRDGLPRLAADRLLNMARPAIGLWPQQVPADLAATASRWGGMPLAPRAWSWPCVEDEPMFFLGQINCAELHGLPGADKLPATGLLAFLADHDAVTGCDPHGESRIFHWPQIDLLQPAKPPIEVQKVLPPAAHAFRPLIDLPHPHSRVVGTILGDPELVRRYYDLYELVVLHGIPEDVRGSLYCSGSKLFGWPRLVQNDLDDIGMPQDRRALRLLLQVDPYGNGNETEPWGPGGSLYFLVRDADLRGRRFDRAEFEMQSS